MGVIRRDWALLAAALLFLGSLALFWPGFADYDTVFQYDQLLAGEFTDWHPPIMARLWALLHAGLGGSGQPMLVLQMGLYWLGLGLIAAALSRGNRPRASLTVLLIGCWPPFLGWQAHLLKDAQMAGAATAASGLIGWWRLRCQRLPAWGWALTAALLFYAVLVRANAVFAVVPFTAMLLPARSLVRCFVATLGVLAVIALSGPVNHQLLGAAPSGVEKTQALYDLAGIAVHSGDPATGLPSTAIATLRAQRCVKPFFWDPLGEQCNDAMDGLRDRTAGALYPVLVVAVFSHPIAYAEHRLSHWNSTERWLVPFRWPGAAPPAGSEPNDDGLRSPRAPAPAFERLAGWCLEFPFGWPILGLALAIAALWVSRARVTDPAAELARALLVSAVVLELSFLGLSIASDWRYHLWPMLAEALGLILLGAPRGGERRATWRAGVVLLVLMLAGVVARVILPAPPITYAGMLHA